MHQIRMTYLYITAIAIQIVIIILNNKKYNQINKELNENQ